VLEKAGSVAAPLLAGVSFALVVFVLQLPSSAVRWPDVALDLLVAAGLLLVAALQAIFWADGRETGGWALLATICYDTGTLCLVAAIVILLIPGAGSPIRTTRLIGILMATVGFIAESVWVGFALMERHRGYVGQRAAERALAASGGAPYIEVTDYESDDQPLPPDR
jgi:hypothetical protein